MVCKILESCYRTHTCGVLTRENEGERVTLSGWLHRKRDHGGLIFVDLRDHYGLIQLVFAPEDEASKTQGDAFSAINDISVESVIQISGIVVLRDSDTINTNIPTGHVEIHVEKCSLLAPAQDLPLPIFGEIPYPEDIRLKYRFLDLRRQRLHDRMILRSKFISSLRRRMGDAGFLEFQTPILTASSPEGARDFLVPSRMHPGKFYALPQAPQQFKQLIMISGFDRYFQIAPCFRDEDARADRLPGDFYQLDVEMSFVEQEDVLRIMEPIIISQFEEFLPKDRVVEAPFLRLSYQEALDLYGTDKPDLRNPLQLCNVTDIFKRDDVELRAFKDVVEKGGVVLALRAPDATKKPRSFFDKLNNWAISDEGAKGLGYISFDEAGEAKGPLAKFFSPQALQGLISQVSVQNGDALFFIANQLREARAFGSRARDKLAQELDIVDRRRFSFVWIVDFPLFEKNPKTGLIEFGHNPFSMPQGGMEGLDAENCLNIKAYQYDLVCNGVELSSGAIRTHRLDILHKAFAIAGYEPSELDEIFPGLVSALRYGAPPHGGIAPGIERMLMLICEEENLRDVTMFPLTQKGEDLMMKAPCSVKASQLKELGLALNKTL